jgi:hypothetical protein
MKNKIIIAVVIIALALAGWGVMRYRAERARHAIDAAQQSAQVKAMAAEKARIEAEYAATEHRLADQVELANAKASQLQRALDSMPPIHTAAEIEAVRKDVSKTWEVKFTLLQVDYNNALDEIAGYKALTLTLRQQIEDQGNLISTQINHIADLNKLIGTAQIDITKAIAERIILQDKLASSRMWGTVKTVGLGAVVVWVVLQAVRK